MERNNPNWRKLSSVKVRVLLFLCFMSVMFVFSNVYSIYHGVRCEQQFDQVLTKYYAIHRFQTVFSDSPVFFEEYMEEKTEENWMRFINNELQVQEALWEMVQEADGMSMDSFFLIQSIKNTYLNYDAIARDGQPANHEVRQLVLVKQAAAQIEEYTAELLQVSLSYGTDVHRDMQANMSLEHRISLVLMAVVLCVSLLCGLYMNRRVLDPLKRLSETVAEITGENFAVEDLPTDRTDEIGRLNRAVNRMKQAMGDIIGELKEKQILSQKVHAQELALMNREKMLEQAKFSLLQSQINPHFLFNTLNVIAGAAAKEQARVTGELIRNLSDLFRYTLESKGETVRLSQELQVLSRFMYIERKRFGERLQYRLRVDVEPDQYRIPPFTLQPLIENSIRHGVLVKEAGGTVGLSIRECGDELVICVLDNGVGMTKEKAKALMREEPEPPARFSHGPEDARDAESGTSRGDAAKPGTGMGVKNVLGRLRLVFPGSRIKVFSKVSMGTCIEIRIAREACKNA